MESVASGVVKRDKVAMSGECNLAAAGRRMDRPRAEPRVRIIEQNERGNTIVEIVCSCGETIHLCCTHAAGQTDGSAK